MNKYNSLKILTSRRYSAEKIETTTEKTIFPASVRNISIKNLTSRKNPNLTPGASSLINPTRKQPIAQLSRRFTQVRKNSREISSNQIKIPETLKKLKQKLSNLSNLLMQEPSTRVQSFNDFVRKCVESLNLIKSFGPVDLKQLKEKKVYVPRKLGFEHKKTLIFDLDETLVHCCVNGEESDIILEIRISNGKTCETAVNIRPFVGECLRRLAENFEIFVFTASHKVYADAVCDYIDPNGDLIHARFYRESCICTEGYFIKDLRIFVNRNIQDIILIDNTLHCAAYQVDNCVPIISWFDDRNDSELLKLEKYLNEINKVDDIRLANKKYFNLSGF